jgi:hypothetical protein
VAGCSKSDDLETMIMFEDAIYIEVDEDISKNKNELTRVGTITSQVERHKTPIKNNQTNGSIAIGEYIYIDGNNYDNMDTIFVYTFRWIKFQRVD